MPSPGLGSPLQGGKSLQQIPVSVTGPPFLQGAGSAQKGLHWYKADKFLPESSQECRTLSPGKVHFTAPS